MAKFGEGDPRWLVKDMGENGRNVNSWHWEEKDCSKWAHSRLKEILSSIEISDMGDLTVIKVDKLSGDATYMRRKGKNILLYDLDCKVTWEGTLEGKKVTGFVHFPSICDDTETEQMECTVRLDSKKGDIGDRLLAEMTAKAPGILRGKLSGFVKELYDHVFTGASSVANSEAKPKPLTTVSSVTKISDKPATSTTSGKVRCSSFSVKMEWFAPARELFACLTDPNRLSAYQQSQAEMKGEEGSKFTLFHGSITGTIEKFDAPTTLVQKWRFGTWPNDHYSTVEIKIEDCGPSCNLELKHTGIPYEDLERTKSGWRENFWHRIRGMFGFNFKIVN